MTTMLADVVGLLLLIVGARLGSPVLLRLLCRIAVLYIAVFSVCYYIWLAAKFHAFKSHPDHMHNGVSAAFAFQGFWKVFANMVLLQGFMPVAVILLLYFAITWLSASTKPGSSYY